MKNLILAGVVIFGAVGVLLEFQTLLLGFDAKAAWPIASSPILGFSKVHQILEQGNLKASFRALPKGVVNLQGFALPWYQMLIYGALIFVPLKELGGFIGGLVAGAAGVSEAAAFIWIVGAIGNLMVFSGMYLVGTWIGARASKYGWLLGVAVPVVGQVLAGVIDFLFLSDAQFSQLFGQPKSIGLFAEAVAVGGLLAAIFCLLGVWRGRRARLSSYLAYLLGSLPPNTQDTIVDLAYGEVKTLSTQQPSAQAAQRPQTA